MFRRRWVWGIVAGLALIAVLSGFLLFFNNPEKSPGPQQQKNAAILNLGLVYLPVTQKIADCYGLEVNSGALVTQVTNDSLCDHADIKAGDVIVNFNGTQISESNPLLGMLLSCQSGESISMVIWNGGRFREVSVNNSGQ